MREKALAASRMSARFAPCSGGRVRNLPAISQERSRGVPRGRSLCHGVGMRHADTRNSLVGRLGALAVALVAGFTGGLAQAQATVALPDLNGDGVADYFMRLPVWSRDTDVVGQFRVFSGADNS